MEIGAAVTGSARSWTMRTFSKGRPVPRCVHDIDHPLRMSPVSVRSSRSGGSAARSCCAALVFGTERFPRSRGVGDRSHEPAQRSHDVQQFEIRPVPLHADRFRQPTEHVGPDPYDRAVLQSEVFRLLHHPDELRAPYLIEVGAVLVHRGMVPVRSQVDRDDERNEAVPDPQPTSSQTGHHVLVGDPGVGNREKQIVDGVQRGTQTQRVAVRLGYSKAIIEAIAAEEGITTAKVRHILAVGGPGYVRWTKADVVNTPAEGQKVREAFVEFADTPRDAQFLRTRATFVSKVSDEQYLTVKAITKYAKANGFWPWAGTEQEDYQREVDSVADAKRRQDGVNARSQREIKLPSDVENNDDTGIRFRRGPDKLGWMFIILISLLLATCVSNMNDGKSELQRNTDLLCRAVGGCR